MRKFEDVINHFSVIDLDDDSLHGEFTKKFGILASDENVSDIEAIDTYVTMKVDNNDVHIDTMYQDINYDGIVIQTETGATNIKSDEKEDDSFAYMRFKNIGKDEPINIHVSSIANKSGDSGFELAVAGFKDIKAVILGLRTIADNLEEQLEVAIEETK